MRTDRGWNIGNCHGFYCATWDLGVPGSVESATDTFPIILEAIIGKGRGGFSAKTSYHHGENKHYGELSPVDDAVSWLTVTSRSVLSSGSRVPEWLSMLITHRGVPKKEVFEANLDASDRPCIASSCRSTTPMVVMYILFPLAWPESRLDEAGLVSSICGVFREQIRHPSFRYGYLDVGVPDDFLFFNAHYPTPPSWEGSLANQWWNEYGIHNPPRARGVFWANAFGRAMGSRLRTAGLQSLAVEEIADYLPGAKPTQLFWDDGDAALLLLDDEPYRFARERDRYQEPEEAIMVGAAFREALSRAALM
jgi:hypothetical protein